jgi:hypothetical protein
MVEKKINSTAKAARINQVLDESFPNLLDRWAGGGVGGTLEGCGWGG